MSRTAGLRGRLPVKPVGERFAIDYAHNYLISALPAPTYPIDVTESITDFGMMNNDSYGNCGPVSEVHLEMTTAAAAKVKGPASDSVLALSRYEQFTGSQTPPGPGVNLADYWLWLYRGGLIKAFAPVDVKDRAQADGLMQAGFGLIIGATLCDNSEDQFNKEQPWDPAGLQPNPNDGHAIVRVKSDGTGLSAYVTWGAVQPATYAWDDLCVEEGWLVVTTQEQLALFNSQLLIDIESLGGTGGTGGSPVPVVPTPPAPAPPAPPVPVPTDPSWIKRDEERLKVAIEDIENDLKKEFANPQLVPVGFHYPPDPDDLAPIRSATTGR